MKSKGMWIIVSVLVVLGLLIGSFGCAAPAPAPTPAPTPTPAPKPIVLKAVSSIGQTYPVTIQLERAIDLIKERSGGRIDFEYHAYGSLYNLKEASDAIMDNLAQIGNFKGGYYPEKLGVASEIANLPYNYSFEGFSAHRRDPGGFFDWISPYYERNGAKLLSYDVIPPSIGIISKKPIRKLEDLKGVLMRCVAGAAARGFELLGTEPVFMPTGEIYEGLLRGTVDATNSSLSSSISAKYYEAAKYYIMCEYTTAGVELAMNLDTFNSLPSDLQKIIVDALVETEEMLFEETPLAVEQQIKDMEAEGVEFIYLDKSEIARWAAAIQPLYDEYAQKYGAEWEQFLKIREPMR